jgi:ATP-dependent helicase/nuclease subunit B
MFDQNQSRVFALPCGCDFPAALVAGLRARLHSAPPEAMARVTLYVNTNRMQARITSIFTQNGASFLPKLRLITDLASDARVRLPSPISKLRRQLILSNLITALLQAQPNLAPRAAVFDLATSLTQLLDEMQSEGVSPDTLAGLDVSQHSEHWQRAQAFLRIITPLFAQDNGPEARRRAAVSQLAALWQAVPPQDPIIVAGTTGSRRATAEFMQNVAALPQGALILPGFDFDTPDAVWQQMDDVLTSEDHPQFRFRKLMDRLNISHRDIALWHNTPSPAPSRNRLISLSLRPAPVTDQWLRDGPDLDDLITATQDLTLIEAPSARSEAVAIALILREAAHNNVKAALITPDRMLSRQVTAALDRFGIIPDDSAGRPLALSAAGRFLRHIAELRCEVLTIDRLIALLKHPLCASGQNRGVHLLLTRELELKLRHKGPAFPSLGDVTLWAAAQNHPDAAAWAQSLAPIFAANSGAAPLPLADHIAQHMRLAEAIAAGAPDGSGALWHKAAGEAALALMREMATEADAGGEMTAQEYRHMFDSLIMRQDLREAVTAHPNVLIWGTIEARVQGCDLVILGGLNDAIWPKLPAPDPWLNRKMRKDAGLLLPDRQIGLAAHDYQQAIGAPRVVLTRALRNSESETVPSRWLNRLTNLMEGLPQKNGKAALAAMRERGKTWLAMGAALDLPQPAQRALPYLQPSPRPAPQPPLAARPKELALTALETLIINPYHIYARYILRLRPLPPLRAQLDARDRGTVIHKILEEFVKHAPDAEPHALARARLMALADQVLRQEIPFPMTRALWMARIFRAADKFLTKTAAFEGRALAMESKGRLTLPDLGFTLLGTPDRIDLLPDGRLHLIDYKTGAPPPEAAQKTHRKQLLFAALLAQKGGFAQLGPVDVAKISYVSLGGDVKIIETNLTPERLAEEWADLTGLIAAYGRYNTGYTARRADFESRHPRDFDHLSRFGEWQTSDPATPILLGTSEQEGGQ